ncbi:crcB-like protein, camphor resistance (CrcB) domain-containing protein [Hirsutella rhossiliensis]|uniref:CrcB-like protein, camphor resistance (CrcB) domain-containing protein n=1 Tax=Hirsutella rhossiliensis TaxID=111463 RepID=A0A9P8MS42_9HYPO|nr:crcB-like protein, camphor resistance (CrcB) domain-containing protein [Hirsutella rhossiliensis]KAH0960265.1 crcB-like protein, camphor resistance (CrcB) domain-containing protein [Hirsutella rhossiliensis]
MSGPGDVEVAADEGRGRASHVAAANGHGSPQQADVFKTVAAEPSSPPRLLATRVYTLSYLVFFSLLGTLARLGLTALTHYLDSPVIFDSVWANFGGSLVIGFLAEDRNLFRHEGAVDDRKAHLALKKTVPLYIGLATGFCGSFTSFSSFIRDAFLALSHDLVAPGHASTAGSRGGGQSFMALLAVVVTTVSLSLSGLFLGAHLACAAERLTPSLPRAVSRKVLDPLSLVLGWGCWLGAVLLSIFPPHDDWRGRAVFALVLAPLGCLLRFSLAVHLNGRRAAFPLGTFAANVAGSAVLAGAWDLAHSPAAAGAVVGCQVLQGVEDGFCGCLTTVSTWVTELSGLGRRDAYVYGSVSVVVSFALVVAVMGGLRWTEGFSPLTCG